MMCSHIVTETYTYILPQPFDVAASFSNDSSSILKKIKTVIIFLHIARGIIKFIHLFK